MIAYDNGPMKRHKEKGFSMLEILITVGLLGVLTAVAVPSYKNYLRSSKTVEAQSSLSQIYMAEKTFYLQWRFYTYDLKVIGAIPEGEMLYNAGFSSGSGHDSTPSAYRGPNIEPINSSNHHFFKVCGKTFSSSPCAFKNKHNKGGFTPPSIPGGYKTKTNTFKALAIADLINRNPKRGATNTDQWSINENK